jgi:hypothetical protein
VLAEVEAGFDLLVSLLTKVSVSLVLDMVEGLPQHSPYYFLKDKLLLAHQLTNFQRIANLHNMEPLGAKKPS